MAETLDSKSPGSLAGFAESRGLSSQSTETLTDFTKAAGEYQVTLSRHLGITLEELHVLPNPQVDSAPAGPSELAV